MTKSKLGKSFRVYTLSRCAENMGPIKNAGTKVPAFFISMFYLYGLSLNRSSLERSVRLLHTVGDIERYSLGKHDNPNNRSDTQHSSSEILSV